MRILLCFLCLSFCAHAADSLQDCYNGCTQLATEKIDPEEKLKNENIDAEELETEVNILSED